MDISSKSKVLILDFDHTLFLSNSTEEYLDSARPKVVCALLLTLIDWLKIWKIFPGDQKRLVYRDPIRVIIISVLLPWTYILYLSRASYLSKKYINESVKKIIFLRDWEKLVIASNGSKFILKPLLKAAKVEQDLLLGSGFLPFGDSIRSLGKKFFIQRELLPHELKQATFITDNEEDKNLVDIVGEFKFFRWPQERRFRAGQNVYIPFVYTHASKRGNDNHLLNVVILEDFPIILLAYIFTSSYAFDLLSLVSLFCLVLSFWCIYEVGYFENDLFELRYEAEHKNVYKLKYIEKIQNFPLELFAWIWALGLGSLGIALMQREVCTSFNCLTYLAANVSLWAIWLISVRVIYRIYNGSDFRIRQLFFPLLQISRLAGPVLFFSVNFLGVFLIVAQVVSRWVGYLVYRGGGNPKQINQKFVRHIVFIMLAAGLAIIQESPQIFISLQFVVILTWSIVRGHFKPLMKNTQGKKPDLGIVSSDIGSR